VGKAIDFISRLPLPLNYDGNIQVIAQLFPDGIGIPFGFE